jgi:hypothetical protein
LHIFCKSARYLVELLPKRLILMSHSKRIFFLLSSVLGISSLNIFLEDFLVLLEGFYYDRSYIKDLYSSAMHLSILLIFLMISSLSVGLVVARGVYLFYYLDSVFCYLIFDLYKGGLSYILGTVFLQFKSSLSSLLGAVFPFTTISYRSGSLLL